MRKLVDIALVLGVLARIVDVGGLVRDANSPLISLVDLLRVLTLKMKVALGVIVLRGSVVSC